MNLLVDIGNTLTKIAVSDGKSILTEFKLKSIDLDFVKDVIRDNNIINSAISNVSKPNQKLFDLCDSKSNLFTFKKEVKLPFNNPYDYGLVGEDRLSLIMGACSMYPQDNVLVVDLGTCITYDIKTCKNNYQAGGISPGIGLRKKSLSSGTANLYEIDPIYPKSMIASDTHSSISIGLLIGIQSEIEGMIKRYKKIYKNLKIVISGGDAKFLGDKIKNTIFTNSNFVFTGLNYLIEYNKLNE